MKMWTNKRMKYANYFFLAEMNPQCSLFVKSTHENICSLKINNIRNNHNKADRRINPNDMMIGIGVDLILSCC